MTTMREAAEAAAGARNPPIVLWGRASSCNVQKAIWALEELGLCYRRIDAGGDFGGLDDPAYLAMNPHGRIPTLRDGATVVWESEAIVRYLAARYGAGTLWPQDPAARAAADQWMAWTAARLYPDWIALFWRLVRTPPAKRDNALIERLRAATAERMEMLDRHLAHRPFVAGDALTVGDIPAGMTLYRWFAMAIDRPPMPHLEAWYRRLCDRPAYRARICIPFDELVGKEGY
ncbi:MAG: glutathione S-transferase [Alphaproteobacteria bacterium]